VTRFKTGRSESFKEYYDRLTTSSLETSFGEQAFELNASNSKMLDCENHYVSETGFVQSQSVCALTQAVTAE